MKRKLLLVISSTLILSITLMPSTVLAAGSEVGLAKKAAQVWLNYAGSLNSEVSQWQGASVTSPQAYHNLKGEVVAFLFTIVGKGGTAGYIMVGNSQYSNVVFEASDADPPALPTSEEVKATVESLGLGGVNEITAKPIDLVYAGPGDFLLSIMLESKK